MEGMYSPGDMFLIVGLGNPGPRYANTRHNMGFDTVDLLSRKYGIKVSKIAHKALIGEGTAEGRRIVLAKPQTYMNLSGESVRDIVAWYKTPLSNVILVYDDIDIEFGRIRIRPKGSSGSHNGMKSVIYQLESDEFPRVRIGIGKPPEGYDLADYVLGRFTKEEREIIDASIERAACAIGVIITLGIDEAMARYNA